MMEYDWGGGFDGKFAHRCEGEGKRPMVKEGKKSWICALSLSLSLSFQRS